MMNPTELGRLASQDAAEAPNLSFLPSLEKGAGQSQQRPDSTVVHSPASQPAPHPDSQPGHRPSQYMVVDTPNLPVPVAYPHSVTIPRPQEDGKKLQRKQNPHNPPRKVHAPQWLGEAGRGALLYLDDARGWGSSLLHDALAEAQIYANDQQRGYTSNIDRSSQNVSHTPVNWQDHVDQANGKQLSSSKNPSVLNWTQMKLARLAHAVRPPRVENQRQGNQLPPELGHEGLVPAGQNEDGSYIYNHPDFPGSTFIHTGNGVYQRVGQSVSPYDIDNVGDNESKAPTNPGDSFPHALSNIGDATQDYWSSYPSMPPVASSGPGLPPGEHHFPIPPEPTQHSGSPLPLQDETPTIPAPYSQDGEAGADGENRTSQEPRPGAEVLADGLRENASNRERIAEAEEVMRLVEARRVAEEEYHTLLGKQLEPAQVGVDIETAKEQAYLAADEDLLDAMLDDSDDNPIYLIIPYTEVDRWREQYREAVRLDYGSERNTTDTTNLIISTLPEQRPENIRRTETDIRNVLADHAGRIIGQASSQEATSENDQNAYDNYGLTPQIRGEDKTVRLSSTNYSPSTASIAESIRGAKPVEVDEVPDHIEEPDTVPLARETTGAATGNTNLADLAERTEQDARDEAKELQAREANEILTLIRARDYAEQEYERLRNDQAMHKYLSADTKVLDLILDDRSTLAERLLSKEEIDGLRDEYFEQLPKDSDFINAYNDYDLLLKSDARGRKLKKAAERYNTLLDDIYREIANTLPEGRDKGIQVVEEKIRDTLEQRAIDILRNSGASQGTRVDTNDGGEHQFYEASDNAPDWMKRFMGDNGAPGAQPDISDEDTAVNLPGLPRTFIADPTTEHTAVKTAPKLVSRDGTLDRIARTPTKRLPKHSAFLNDTADALFEPEAASEPTPGVRRVNISRDLDIIHNFRENSDDSFMETHRPYNLQPMDIDSLAAFSNSFRSSRSEVRQAYDEVFVVIRNIGARRMGFENFGEMGTELQDDLDILATLLIYTQSSTSQAERSNLWPYGVTTTDTERALKDLMEGSMKQGKKRRNWLNWVLSHIPGDTAIEHVLGQWSKDLRTRPYIVRDGKLERVSDKRQSKRNAK